MSEKEKSPEERGREAARAAMAGAEHVVEEGLKSVGGLAKWGCIGYIIFFVIVTVIAFVVFALCDLLSVIPSWLIVVGIVVALVIYFATRKPSGA